MIEPEVLLLDEPLSNLDARLRVEMRVELRQLQRKLGITAIYVTHDQEDANAIADSIAVLDQGRIQQIGTPIELYDRPANRFVATFLGTANLIEGTIEAGGRFVADGFALPAIGGAPGPRLHLDPPAGHFGRRRPTAASPRASPSANSSAASRATTRRPARSRSWSTCRTGAAPRRTRSARPSAWSSSRRRCRCCGSRRISRSSFRKPRSDVRIVEAGLWIPGSAFGRPGMTKMLRYGTVSFG